MLLSIIGTYHSFPDDLTLYIDEITEILKDDSKYKKPTKSMGNFYSK